MESYKVDNNRSTIQPRLLHPKKRKFDLADLEELKISNSDAGTSVSSNNNPIKTGTEVQKSFLTNTNTIIAVSSAVVPQMVITNMATNISSRSTGDNSTPIREHQDEKNDSDILKKTILYSCKPLMNTVVSLKPHAKKISTNGLSPLIAFAKTTQIAAPNHNNALFKPTERIHESDIIELSDWCDTRVLAKRNGCYVTGIIKSSEIKGAVFVEFDYPEGANELYKDIFYKGQYSIISDASPSISDVSIDQVRGQLW